MRPSTANYIRHDDKVRLVGVRNECRIFNKTFKLKGKTYVCKRRIDKKKSPHFSNRQARIGHLMGIYSVFASHYYYNENI